MTAFMHESMNCSATDAAIGRCAPAGAVRGTQSSGPAALVLSRSGPCVDDSWTARRPPVHAGGGGGGEECGVVVSLLDGGVVVVVVRVVRAPGRCFLLSSACLPRRHR